MKHFGRFTCTLLYSVVIAFVFVYRNYIRMYPALVNCTTVIYFSEWPAEALIDVAEYFLLKSNFEVDIHRRLAKLCSFIHLSTKNLAVRMKDELRREVFITPTNYLQFVRHYTQYG